MSYLLIKDNLSSSNLYRLTGIKDKTKTGYQKNKTMYLGLLNYMEALEETELNLLFEIKTLILALIKKQSSRCIL